MQSGNQLLSVDDPITVERSAYYYYAYVCLQY